MPYVATVTTTAAAIRTGSARNVACQASAKSMLEKKSHSSPPVRSTTNNVRQGIRDVGVSVGIGQAVGRFPMNAAAAGLLL
jgi:hypothetical protein